MHLVRGARVSATLPRFSLSVRRPAARAKLASAPITSAAGAAAAAKPEEHFDILDEQGNRTGVSRPRKEVHALGLLHRAVHVWLFCPATGELVLQRRAACKDSWPDRWDISSAGHLSAGEESLPTAVREVEEELGLRYPEGRFRFLFTHFERLESVQKGKPFKNFEFNDVYLVTLTPEERAALAPENSVIRRDEEDNLGGGGEGGPAVGGGSASAAASAAAAAGAAGGANSRWVLQGSEVSAVCYRPWRDVAEMYANGDPTLVPTSDLQGSYARLFGFLEEEERAWAQRR
jgi:isopentenyldiphosphate isomerase